MDLHGLLRGQINFLYIGDVRTSQETHLWTSTACYKASFTFYIGVMSVPHRKHVWASTACYRDRLTFYM
jgi:hypothetical protein